MVKLMIICTNVLFNNRQNDNCQFLEQAVTRAFGRQLFQSLVSPLFLIIRTIAVFMNSDGKYLLEMKQLN